MKIYVISVSLCNDPYHYIVIGVSDSQDGADKLISKTKLELIQSNYNILTYFKIEVFTLE